ncbi:(4Fe-4S)-binding protein [candidate division WOR-3 bacterium 4484_100]|uniref:(4Fe-4S)-binding protein n=1 Tax=candidate division WOR-3 bacterium 4484_100 TaxID=1936077 RepID=A0A1V4QE13_UNCW3|nr:MAG: (4Fe-4S)-binding protein [candidate division WOR-3 bacterium 4484_100]
MIISFASGKGGTGKTTVAVNFAIYLSQHRNKSIEKIFFLDCDVEEPNAGIFLKPKIVKIESVDIFIPRVNLELCTFCGKCSEVCAYNAIAVLKNDVLVFEQLCHGCGGCSLFCPTQAISEVPRQIGVIEKGRSDRIEFAQGRLNIGEAMATPLIRNLKKLVLNNSKGSIFIIDVPPGTSCPVIEAIKESNFTVLVTEPTPFGLNDLQLAVETVRKLQIPMGVVINRSGDSDNLIEEYCRKQGIPVLVRIPLNREIAHFYSQGIPIINVKEQYRDFFAQLVQKILENMSHQTIIDIEEV